MRTIYLLNSFVLKYGAASSPTLLYLSRVNDAWEHVSCVRDCFNAFFKRHSLDETRDCGVKTHQRQWRVRAGAGERAADWVIGCRRWRQCHYLAAASNTLCGEHTSSDVNWTHHEGDTQCVTPVTAAAATAAAAVR